MAITKFVNVADCRMPIWGLSGHRVGVARPRVLVPMVRVLGMPVTRVLEIEVVFVANALVATGLFDMHMGMVTFVVNAGGRFHLRKPPRSRGCILHALRGH
jgi:hypothetical protein